MRARARAPALLELLAHRARSSRGRVGPVQLAIVGVSLAVAQIAIDAPPRAVYTRCMFQLLGPEDPPPFRSLRPDGTSVFVVTCDHAGRALPRKLNDLGVSGHDLTRHIAWDIGAAEVATRLADLLDASLVMSTYSRLVIDANRPPDSPQSIVTRSERTDIPGNVGLSREEIEARQREVLAPYQNEIGAVLDRRKRRGQASVLVSIHSFTPSFMDAARRWHAGVLYNRDPRLGHVMLELLRSEPELVIGDNEPYAVRDETDYTIGTHGEKRGLLHVELEIRQDLIDHATGQVAWAERLARHLERARIQLGVS